MSGILNFLANNYVWFIVISLILLFALIGYLVDTKQDERFSKKIEIDKELESRMNVAEATNMTINQMVKANETVSGESNVSEAVNPDTPVNSAADNESSSN